MSYLTAFNNQLIDFSRELCEMFPRDNDIKWSHNMITLMKSANPRKLFDVFIKFFTNYRQSIMAKDETFFTTHDFKEIGQETNKQEYTQTIVRQLKNHWSNMSTKSREMTWLRFEILFKISDKICTNSGDGGVIVSTG
jgi:hypothetical protein